MAHNDYSNSSYSPASSTYSATVGDGDGKPSSELSYWNVKYSYSIKVHVGVPNTMEALVSADKMEKELIRSLSTTGGNYWKRPAYIAMIYYVMTVMKFSHVLMWYFMRSLCYHS